MWSHIADEMLTNYYKKCEKKYEGVYSKWYKKNYMIALGMTEKQKVIK